MVIRICSGINSFDKNRSGSGTEEIESGADERLIRLEVDASNTEQRGVDHAEQDCCQHDKQDHDESAGSAEVAHHESAAECSDDHNAFETEVNDTGMLRNASAECDEDKNRRENKRVLNEKQHYLSPPSEALRARAFFSSLFLRMLFMVILMKRTKPQR